MYTHTSRNFGGRKGIGPGKDLASPIPGGSYLGDVWGSGPNWRFSGKTGQLKQKLKLAAAVV